MKNIHNIFAAALAAIIGSMAVFAGAKVLLGNNPGYYVISWLPLYNFSMGILSIFVALVFILKQTKFTDFVVLVALGLHSTVFIILQTIYRDVVATESIKAMVIRISVWAVIFGILYFPKRSLASSISPEP